MELNEYQSRAMSTCMSSSANVGYMLTNLVGEVGELSSKIAKAIRKGNAMLSGNDLHFLGDGDNQVDLLSDIVKELGDVQWQVAGLANVLGVTLEDVCRINLYKLSERKKNGTIDGSGDGVTKAERL